MLYVETAHVFCASTTASISHVRRLIGLQFYDQTLYVLTNHLKILKSEKEPHSSTGISAENKTECTADIHSISTKQAPCPADGEPDVCGECAQRQRWWEGNFPTLQRFYVSSY